MSNEQNVVITVGGEPYRSLRFFPTWNPLNVRQLHGLMCLAQDVSDNASRKKSWVEIGTHNGEGASILLGFKYIEKLYCIDIKENDIAKIRLAPATENKRCEIFTTTSVDAAAKISEVDVVYVDGDHSYEAVKKDIDTWWTKIPEGGVLCGHDYHAGWPGVVQAVDEFIAKYTQYTLNRYVDGSWAIFK